MTSTDIIARLAELEEHCYQVELRSYISGGDLLACEAHHLAACYSEIRHLSALLEGADSRA